jgi:hypothetical protein
VVWRRRPPFVGPRLYPLSCAAYCSLDWTLTQAAGPSVRVCNFVSLLTNERLEHLAHAANAAPSADNRHAFQVSVDGEVLCLWPSATFHHPPPHRRILSLLSIGAALENLRLRALKLGLRLVRLSSLAAPAGTVAALRAEMSGPETEQSLEAAIEGRCSNRAFRYRKTGVPGEQLQAELTRLIEGLPGASVAWLDSSDRRQVALQMLRRSEAARFFNHALHRELFDSIRFDVGWHASADRGLPPGALCLPFIERLGFTLLRKWSVQRVCNVVGVHRMIGIRAADLPCRWAPHLLALTTQCDSDEDTLLAGQALQRVWLGAAARGLAAQLFAAPCLYAHKAAVDAPPELQNYLRQQWAELCPGQTAWAIMRLGRAVAPTVRAGRPPVHQLWLR